MHDKIRIAVGVVLSAVLLAVAYTNCSGGGSSGGSSGSTTSTAATGYTYLSVYPSSVIVDTSSTTTFYAEGGSGSYSYTLVSGIGSIAPGTGIYTAPTTTGTAEIEVTDTAGDVAYASVTVASSSSTGSGSIVAVCTTSTACGSAVGMPRELDAENLSGADNGGLTNATEVCLQLGYSALSTYQVTTHGISCGGSYGLADWNGSKFSWSNYGICSYGEVTVVSEIACLE